MSFSGDESIVVAGTEAGKIRVFANPGGEVLVRAQAHTANVTSIAVDRQGRLIATASADRTIRLWKRDDGGLAELFTLRFHSPVVAAHLSADGQTLAGAGVARIGRANLAHSTACTPT